MTQDAQSWRGQDLNLDGVIPAGDHSLTRKQSALMQTILYHIYVHAAPRRCSRSPYNLVTFLHHNESTYVLLTHLPT